MRRACLGWILSLCMMISAVSQTEAARLFDSRNAGVKIFIGEIQSYGDYELKASAFENFADKLRQELNQQNLMAISNATVTNEEGRHSEGASGEGAVLSKIHMDAIVHGHQFEHGYAAAKLVRYADETMGRKVFYDDERVAAWKKQPQQTYFLSQGVQPAARRIAEKYGAAYLLFVNVKDVDVRLKHGLFASHTTKENRGKKMKAALDYYLINASTGRVYEGHCENRKTAQLYNLALVQGGKGMNVDELLNHVMEAQTDDIVKDMVKNGMKAVQ